MQTARRYDPRQDAKFHVSIVTEEVRRKWATPRPEWTGPTGTVLNGTCVRELDIGHWGPRRVPPQSSNARLGALWEENRE